MDFVPGNDSSEWQVLGDEERYVLYQQVTVQEPMGWSGLSLDCYKAACGKYSGPIALKWNSDETLPMNCDVDLTTDILIYDSCGKKIAQIPGKDWQYTRVSVMGWTSTEKLFIVFEDGQYVVFSNTGEVLHQMKLFKETLSDVVFNANTTEDGFVAFSKNNHVLYVDCSGVEPVVTAYPDLPIVAGNRVECSCVFEARSNESNKVEFVVSCMDQSMYFVAFDSITEINIAGRIQGHVIALTPSASNDYVASFSDEGWMDVFDRNFTEKIVGKNTDCRVAPRGFAWCGDDSVVLYWRTVGLLLINPFADWLKYTYDKDDTLFLVTECDSLRVYSSLKHEIIRCVPPAICHVYSGQDDSCGAQLRQSHEQFIQHVGSIRLLRGEIPEERHILQEGVMECLEAAEEELSTIQQEELLRSAKFGKCFLDGVEVTSHAETEHESESSSKDVDYESKQPESVSITTRFQEVSHTLRVLNALRAPSVAMFLTYRQYQFLGAEAVIRRLLCRHLYFLALKICSYLQLAPDFVLIDWACQKIRRSGDLSDEACRDQIRENLKEYTNISYKDIAMVAYEVNRKRLATMLLEFEPRRADRIPLLLRMGELQLALRTAANSNDSDLMMVVALALYDKEETVPEKLLELLLHFPRIFNSWLFYLQQSNVNRLLNVMNTLLRYEDVFNLLVIDAYHQLDLTKRKEALAKIKGIMTNVVNAGRKDLQFYVHSLQDEMTLIDYKLKLIHITKTMDCANMTIVECIRYAILSNKVDIADAMAKAFKVADKRYWRIKVKALAEAEMFDALAVLAEKKSPIGYIPFVDACAGMKNLHEAANYLPKIKNDEERMNTAMKWNMFEGAFPCAVKLRDVNTLMKILNSSRNDSLKAEVKVAIATIEGNKYNCLLIESLVKKMNRREKGWRRGASIPLPLAC